VLFAKRLLHETRLPMIEVAQAAGFGSLRRFNETFQRLFARPPSALRRRGTASLPEGSLADRGVTVWLRYRPPYDWAAILAHLRARCLDGIEQVDDASYRRTIHLGGDTGAGRGIESCNAEYYRRARGHLRNLDEIFRDASNIESCTRSGHSGRHTNPLMPLAGHVPFRLQPQSSSAHLSHWP